MLLGDAAHTMTPVLGQGCNSGLEDAMIFARMLQQSDGDLDSLLPAYSAARLPELRALISINELATDDRGMITTVSHHESSHVGPEAKILVGSRPLHSTVSVDTEEAGSIFCVVAVGFE